MNLFIACSAFCPGLPNCDPMDSDKRLRIYKSSATMARHAWCVDKECAFTELPTGTEFPYFVQKFVQNTAVRACPNKYGILKNNHTEQVGTSCSFVALHSMHAQGTSPRSMHAHEIITDKNLRWRCPLQR